VCDLGTAKQGGLFPIWAAEPKKERERERERETKEKIRSDVEHSPQSWATL